MNAFVALLRRELWEHRALVLVPAVLAAVIILCVLSSGLWALMHGALLTVQMNEEFLSAIRGPDAGRAIPAFYLGLLACFGLVLSVSVGFYLVDCLYADRRDRSILFWKSLPVSDAETVLSKLTTGLLVAPAASIVAAFVTAMVLAIIGTMFLWSVGIEGTSALWQAKPLLQVTLEAPVIALLIILWYAPIAAWFALASAWAPRAPLLWATLPPIAIGLVESIVYHTTHTWEFLGERFGAVYGRLFAGSYPSFVVHDDGVTSKLPTLSHIGQYLTSLDLWGGLLVAALFTLAAIALRRYRDET
jgi:ABC-2 type transport system permease protein